MLFLGLSIFLYQNIFMLFYSIFEIFLFLFLILLYKLSSVKESLKIEFIILLISLPFVVLLFLFSPRKGYYNFSIGFHQNYVISGFSNILKVDDKSVINSNQIVMEVGFKKKPKEYYFRGDVLYKNYGKFWGESLAAPRDILIRKSNKIDYVLKMYPTNKRYFFALDLPIKAFKGAYLTKYFTIKLKKPLKKPIEVKLTSYTNYTLKLPFIPKVSLEVNKKNNKLTQNAIKDIVKIKDKNKRLKELIKFFISKKVKYTLNPSKIDPYNIVDELLFHKKSGYCTHFASAFAILSRLANLPSRVVTGFVGNEFYKDYMVIRAKDAHAWVEVYTDKWIRIDPVKYAYSSKKNNININLQNKELKENKNLFLMYIRFKIDEWILYYNTYTQKKFIKFIKTHLKEVIIFILIILSSIILLIYYLLRCKDYECQMQKLLRKLEKRKKRENTIYEYLKSFNNEKLNEINNLYHKIKFYKKDKREIKKLIKKIKGFK